MAYTTTNRKAYFPSSVSKNNFVKKTKTGGTLTLHASTGFAKIAKYVSKPYKTSKGVKQIVKYSITKVVNPVRSFKKK